MNFFAVSYSKPALVALFMYKLVSCVSIDSLHCLVCANRTQLLLTYAMHSFAPQLRQSNGSSRTSQGRHLPISAGLPVEYSSLLEFAMGPKPFMNFHDFDWILNQSKKLNFQPEIFKWECSARDKIARPMADNGISAHIRIPACNIQYFIRIWKS